MLDVILLAFGDFRRHRAGCTFRLMWRFHRLHRGDPLMGTIDDDPQPTGRGNPDPRATRDFELAVRRAAAPFADSWPRALAAQFYSGTLEVAL